MNTAHLAVAVVAMICTVGSTLLMWVFSLASLPNASPESVQRVKLWTSGLTMCAVVCLSAAAWLVIVNRPVLAAVVAIVPVIIMAILFIIKLQQ